MALIEFKDVSFVYEDAYSRALNSLSFTVNSGEFVGIIGGTGEGKTTLALCFNGLIPSSIKGDFSGDVTVCGLNTRKTPVSKLATKVGLVFQEPDDQIFSMEVKDEIRFGPSNLGLGEQEIEKRVKSVMKTVDIEELSGRDVNELSEGQKQKVSIASVLAMSPDILVLDEPTSRLDQKNTRMVYEILSKLNAQGKTIIVIEHKMDFLAEYARRILVLEKGRIVLDNEPREVFNRVEQLDRLGIGLPTICRLRDELRKQGMPVSFSTMDGAVSELKRYKKC